MNEDEQIEKILDACDSFAEALEKTLVKKNNRFVIHLAITEHKDKQIRTYSVGTMSRLEQQASLHYLSKDYG